jgi:hypothetical protein
MDPAWTSETMVRYHKSPWHHNLEDIDLKYHRRKSLKTKIFLA